MRIFTVSDIHIDYDQNRHWLHQLSLADYQHDLLILAGDISDKIELVKDCFETLKQRFASLLYVPGNHDLWVHRNDSHNSLEHFALLQKMAADYGIHMQPLHLETVSIVPLLGWYDYSFGQPSPEILSAWMDFMACKWPPNFNQAAITQFFTSMNEAHLNIKNQSIISFSHFLPRLDVMPTSVPANRRFLYPVLGTTRLEAQIRTLQANIHIYGHSHINRYLTLDNTLYINNAFGYPHETYLRKDLRCVFDTARPPAEKANPN